MLKKLSAALTLAVIATTSATSQAKPNFLELEANNQPLTTRFIVTVSDIDAIESEREIIKNNDRQFRSKAFRTQTNKLSERLKQHGLKPSKMKKRFKEGVYTVNIDGIDNYQELEFEYNNLVNSGEFSNVELDTIVSVASLPNDPLIALQWHVNSIDLSAGWDYSTGNSNHVISILDTGHRDWKDGPAVVLQGWDFVEGDSNPVIPENAHYHGAAVTSIAVANTNNRSGIAGTDQHAPVLPIRVLGSTGSGYASDIADGIVWASGGDVLGATQNLTPATFINLSLGGLGTCSSIWQTAIDTAISNGSRVIVAAGNSNVDVSNVVPANCNNVVTVGASTKELTRSSFSNYTGSGGSQIDIYAPGSDMFVWRYDLNGYNAGNGTSYAAPLITGLYSMMLDEYPGLTDFEFIRGVNNTGTPITGCPEGVCPETTVNIANAMEYLQTPDTVDFMFVNTRSNYDYKCKSTSLYWTADQDHLTETQKIFYSPDLNAPDEEWIQFKERDAYNSGVNIRLWQDGYIGLQSCNDKGCGPIEKNGRFVEKLKSYCGGINSPM